MHIPFTPYTQVLREGLGATWQQTIPSDIMIALLRLSASLLRPGGRIALFLPARGAEVRIGRVCNGVNGVWIGCG